MPDASDKKAIRAWNAHLKTIGEAKEANLTVKKSQKTFKFDYMQVQEAKTLEVKAFSVTSKSGLGNWRVFKLVVSTIV